MKLKAPALTTSIATTNVEIDLERNSAATQAAIWSGFRHVRATTLFPEPRPGRVGWPWTEPPAPLPPLMPDGSAWPAISLVTPSLNQGEFIEETLRSVLLQGYPRVELVVIDGGSRDQTVEVLRRYEPWLAYWVSEPDRGQSHAINKGLTRVTGEYVAWLNADDYLLPQALQTWAHLIRARPRAVLWAGAVQLHDRHGRILGIHQPRLGNKRDLARWNFKAEFYQPGCVFRRSVCQHVGGLDERLHYALDPDLWMRMRAVGEFAACDVPIACARLYPEAKSQRDPASLQMELIGVAFEQREFEAARERLLHFGQEMVRAYQVQRGARKLRNRLRRFLRQRLVEPVGRLLHILGPPDVRRPG